MYFGVLLMMEIIKLPAYIMHWKNDSLIHTSIGDLMARDHYIKVFRFTNRIYFYVDSYYTSLDLAKYENLNYNKH